MARYFSRRIIAINLIALAAVLVCAWLSNWQWQRAHYTQTTPASGEIVDFDQLSPLRDFLPPTSVGVKTTVSGTWQENGRMLFSERPLDGKQLINPDPDSKTIVSWAVPVGNWVVDLLNLPDGSSVGVVRGWALPDEVVPPVSGPAEVTGVLQPSEDSLGNGLIQLPNYLTTNALLEVANANMHDGYLVATEPTSSLKLVKPIFDSPQKVGLHWRNVVYTANWIIFGIIIAGMWWRIIQEEFKQTALQTEKELL